MADPVSDEARHLIRESFARQGLMSTLGARMDAIEAGRVTLSLPIDAHLCQQHGFAHAGASFALGDSAAGYAAMTLLDPGRDVLTVEMKINLVAPASGQRLLAVGEVVKPGRRLTVVRATVLSEDASGTRRETALLQGTMIPA